MEHEKVSDLRQRRGSIKFDRRMLFDEPDENLLRTVFSNFFPCAIDASHSMGMWRNVVFYCFSKHFRVLDEAEAAPQYDILFIKDASGIVDISEVKEIK